MKKITKKTKISEILTEKPQAVEELIDAGMGCIGCPMAQEETIEEGCLAHGMDEKEIEELIKRINKK
jgi:hybrid cluster-associated redox disulfide protein